MSYNLIVTAEMTRLLEQHIRYMLNQLQNKQAAEHFLSELEHIYSQLEINPEIYRVSQDPILKSLHYREAKMPGMNYILIYKIQGTSVYILGIFHTRENYPKHFLMMQPI